MPATPSTSSPGHAPAPSGDDVTYDLALLAQSRARWDSSPGLRVVYGDLYRHMQAWSAPGPALELGSGCGNIRDCLPGVVTSDIQRTPYVDLGVSAYAIEDAPGGPWGTIYLLDVLHHLREPLRFFASAARALRPGGRLVMMEPAATPGGRLFYRAFHHEPMAAARLREPHAYLPDSDKGDFANMAMATVLFERDSFPLRERLARHGLRVRATLYRDVFAYPATGGFSGPRLLPPFFLRALLACERRLPQVVLRRIGLRTLVVIERVSDRPV